MQPTLQLYAYNSAGYGYDSAGDKASCGRPYRAGRVYQPPCDLNKRGFCISAGTTYPWHAVRRFVRDNQGLMRRMYGDQRHGHVLRDQLQEDPLYDWQPPRYAKYQHHDDVENELDQEEGRYLRDDVNNDDVLNTKFVYSEEPAMTIKLAGLKTAPHFRPTTGATFTESTNKKELLLDEASSSSTTIMEDVDDGTTDTSTEPSTISSIDRVGDGSEEISFSTSASGTTMDGEELESNSDKPGAILFQDMEEENSKKKPNMDYNKLRGVNACPVKEEVVAPFWANNTRGEVLALLNMYPFEQYVHWEKCTFENRQMYCREGCRCEQQYRLHRLLAYDPNNECRGIFSDWFRFPSCCICKCYDMPPEFRVTSRSPRFYQTFPDF